MAVITALSWAVLAIGLKVALKEASSGTIVWFRCSVASLFLLAYFVTCERKSLEIFKSIPWLGLFASLAIAANYFGYMKGVELTTASNAQIMIQMAPLAFALVGIFYFQERPTRIQALGFATAACGFGFFYWDQILLAALQADRYLLGNLWLLMGAATWAFFATAQKILLKKWTPMQFNLLFFTVSTLSLTPLVEWSELSHWSFPVWALMIALGLNSLVAYVALGQAIQRIPASHVSLVISLNPLLTIALVYWLTLELQVTWLSPEPIEWRGFLGAGLVVSGVIFTLLGRQGSIKNPVGDPKTS